LAPGNLDNWEIPVKAVRREPDPTRLDLFLLDLPDEEMKKQLMKWKE